MGEGNIPFAPSFDHLVYIRVFEGCNLRCKHCFIPPNPKAMSFEDILRIPDLLSDKIPKGQNVLMQWHGGEPTMFGAEWMSKALHSLTDDKRYNFIHGIQTNLLTYSPEWKEVYKKYFGGEVGVSWDPKIRIYNGAVNELESNRKYEEVFWDNLEKLVADGLDPYLVVTGTKVFFEHFKNPIDFFELLSSKGIKRAHIERVTSTGFARRNWLEVGVNNKEYSTYMSRFARSYSLWSDLQNKNGGKNLFLSPFDGLTNSIKDKIDGKPAGYGCWSGKCDTKFHTIDANGYKVGCTAINSEIDNKQANEKLVLDLENLSKERAERQIYYCNSCEFRHICNTGCLAIDFDDGSGECSGGKSFFKSLENIIVNQERTNGK